MGDVVRLAVRAACGLLAAFSLAAGCSIKGDACLAGEQTICACPSGPSGFQTCLPDRSGWGKCSCAASTGAKSCSGPLDTLTDCGACGVKCSPAHAEGASCATGACAYENCVGNYQECDGNWSNGCESDRSKDPKNCGACGVSCAVAGVEHVTARGCFEGKCDYVSCAPLFADCDGDRTNGCERPANTLTDCGGCGVACATSCVTGKCVTL